MLLVGEQGLHILDQRSLDGAVPGLGESAWHGGHGLPVLFDVRYDLLVLAKLNLATSVPGSRLLHVGNGTVAHLGYGWKWILLLSRGINVRGFFALTSLALAKALQSAGRAIFTDEHIVGDEGQKFTLTKLVGNAGLVHPA